MPFAHFCFGTFCKDSFSVEDQWDFIMQLYLSSVIICLAGKVGGGQDTFERSIFFLKRSIFSFAVSLGPHSKAPVSA